MDIERAREFLRTNHRVVLATRRSDGTPQLSPVVAGLDREGRIAISSRETALKTKNLRRDPRASLCVLNDGFFGAWLQVDGTVEVVSLPDAMDALIDYYRAISGEHSNWGEYRAAMEAEQRVILRVTIDRAGPDRSG
jgi:PPOX class probable F420-dependent enzyme